MPKSKQVRFRRSPFLVSYWNEGRLIFENYATGPRRHGRAYRDGSFGFLQPLALGCERFSRHLPAYSPSSLRAAIAQLVRHSLLQRSDRKKHPTEHAMAAWTHWNPAAGFFHFTGRDLPFTADLVRTGHYMEELIARARDARSGDALSAGGADAIAAGARKRGISARADGAQNLAQICARETILRGFKHAAGVDVWSARVGRLCRHWDGLR